MVAANKWYAASAANEARGAKLEEVLKKKRGITGFSIVDWTNASKPIDQTPKTLSYWGKVKWFYLPNINKDPVYNTAKDPWARQYVVGRRKNHIEG